MKKKSNCRIVSVAALLLACVHSTLPAQNHLIRGIVRDSTHNKAIGYANCVLLRSADSSFIYGTISDEKGEFVIKNVDTGNYMLRISIIGYAPYWREVRVQQMVNLGVIWLKQSATFLKTATVTGKRPMYSVDGEKAIYTPTEDPSVQSGTMSDVLQNAPGVEVDAEGNITLRGTSEVEIWINDRPSHMNEEALKQYIKLLPANSIERVEVITNPSARYSSKGAVINIVTNQKIKRNELLCAGLNATTIPSLSPWVSYVWANEKIDLNLYLNGNYSRHDRASDGTTTLFNDNGDTSRHTNYKTETRMPYLGGYAGLNFNWKIDSMTHLSAWMGAFPNWYRNASSHSYEYYEYRPARIDLGYHATAFSRGLSGGAYAGAWFEHRFDTSGRKLSVSINGNYWSNSGWGYEIFAYHNPLRDTLKRRSYSENTNPYGRLSLNYTHPMKNSFVLEAGAETEYGGGSLHQLLDSMSSGSYVNVPLRSHDGEERSSGLKGYMTLQKRWGGLTAKLGLRGERQWKYSRWNYTDGSGSTTVDTIFLGLVPSLHLSYQTKKLTSYSLSYTRRFSVPGSTKLNTFRRYNDYGFETGNPCLLVGYTHNLEAAFNKFIMKFGNVGFNAYYRASANEMGIMTYAGYAPEYFGTLLVNYTLPENIGSSHTEGIEANITYRPKAFFNVRFNASLFNYGYNYNNVNDNKVSYSLRLNLWAKLWNKLEIYANGSYQSPRLGLYSLSNPNKRIGFGCSSDFFQRKMSIYLNVSDIFGWSEWGSNTTAPQYQTTGSQRYKSSFVSLGLTFRFGKMELENKARQGGASNESGGMQ